MAINGVQFDGLENGDELSVASTGLFSDKNVSNGKTVNLTNNYSGIDVGNYSIVDQTTTTADITPKSLSVSGIVANDKTYDGNTIGSVDANGLLLDGLVYGDDVTIDIAAMFDNKNVGSDKEVTLTLTEGGTDVGNYSFTKQQSSIADIFRLNSVTWIGGPNGNWSDPANWAGGAVPDLSNVVNVIVTAGVTPVFDSGVAGPVNIDWLTGGNLQMDGGILNVANDATLDEYTQNGGVFNVGGNFRFNLATIHGGTLDVTGDAIGGDFTQTGGDTTIGGDFTFDTATINDGTLDVTGDAIGGDFTQTGGGTTIGGDFTFDTATINDGTLDVTGDAIGGDFTQDGGDTTIGGNFTFDTAIISDGILDVTGNANGGRFTQSGGTATVGGDLDVADFEQSGGGLGINGSIIVSNSFMQTGSGTISVSGDADITHTMGELTVRNLSGANVRLNSTNGGVQLGDIATSGLLNVTAGSGSITQLPGGTLTVSGEASFNATGDITLDGADNDFRNIVNLHGHNVLIVDGHGDLTLGSILATGAFDASATDGSITQSEDGTIVVDGEATLSAALDLILNGLYNDFRGITNLTGQFISINDFAGGLILGNVEAREDFTAISNDGSLTQSEDSSIRVHGVTTVEAFKNGKPTTVDLSNSKNDFGGLVNVVANNLKIADVDGSVEFGDFQSDDIQESAEESARNAVRDTNTRYTTSVTVLRNVVERFGARWIQMVVDWMGGQTDTASTAVPPADIVNGDIFLRTNRNSKSASNGDDSTVK